MASQKWWLPLINDRDWKSTVPLQQAVNDNDNITMITMKNEKVTIFMHTLGLEVVPGEQRDM